MKKVLFVTSEATPFAKTGGLGDVSGALPKYFNKKEYDVRIIMPKYESMNQRGAINKLVPKIKFLCQFYVNLNWRRQYAGIYYTEFDGVTYYFIDNEYYFSGKNLYNSIEKDAERFAFFSKAALEAIKYLDWTPDILHCNDWETGLVPVFLHSVYGSDYMYRGMKTIMTIHNLSYQGKWGIDRIQDITGLPTHLFSSEEMEFYGCANLLKGGLVYADAITTVSPTYAKDCMTQEGGEGLDGILRKKENVFYGILNGLDYEEYNPATDEYISTLYTPQTVANAKVQNKEFLQSFCELPVDKEMYTIGMVSRLTKQKGLDLVEKVLEEVLSTQKVQLYILGSGDEAYEEMLRRFYAKYHDKMHIYIGYSEEHASRIYAGCDAFLMPSMFEPCGLSQLIAMRYGTLPIVRKTGGLRDTVTAYSVDPEHATGFGFKHFDEKELMECIRTSADVFYYKPEEWYEMQVRAMKSDFTWETAARKYEALYDSLFVYPFED